MLVVSDTSVLLNLCRVSAEELLSELFHEVWIPAAVAGEFSRLARSRPRFEGLVFPGWVRIAPPVVVTVEVRACPDLDSGETGQGLIPVLARLREEAGFWLHPRFETEVLRLAGEA